MKETSYERVIRRYIFNQKEFRELLGIKGDILQIGLEAGLTRKELDEDVSHDVATYYIETEEVRENS